LENVSNFLFVPPCLFTASPLWVCWKSHPGGDITFVVNLPGVRVGFQSDGILVALVNVTEAMFTPLDATRHPVGPLSFLNPPPPPHPTHLIDACTPYTDRVEYQQRRDVVVVRVLLLVSVVILIALILVTGLRIVPIAPIGNNV
jgi:hypothetical protein